MADFKLRCEICGKAFIAHNPRKLRCSESCDLVAKARKAVEYRGRVKKAKEEKHRPRHLINGVPASIRAKVREAMRLGCSYGNIERVRAQEKAAKERQIARQKKGRTGGSPCGRG